jgi:hypothetical protein
MIILGLSKGNKLTITERSKSSVNPIKWGYS